MTKKLTLKIISTSKEGRVAALVNGKKHVYHVDAALIPMIEKLAEYQPGKVLNILKRGRKEV